MCFFNLFFNGNILFGCFCAAAGNKGDLPIAGVFDYIFYLLEGITEVTEKAYKEGKFVFPYIWIAVQFMCAFLVMSYPKNDLEGVGLNVLILSKSKKNMVD